MYDAGEASAATSSQRRLWPHLHRDDAQARLSHELEQLERTQSRFPLSRRRAPYTTCHNFFTFSYDYAIRMASERTLGAPRRASRDAASPVETGHAGRGGIQRGKTSAGPLRLAAAVGSPCGGFHRNLLRKRSRGRRVNSHVWPHENCGNHTVESRQVQLAPAEVLCTLLWCRSCAKSARTLRRPAPPQSCE